MTLFLHRASRTDLLADGLAGLLAEPLADPFAQEVVVVPTKGVERWLGQRLAHRLGTGARGGDGVCAGVRFLQPGSLVAMLLDRDRDDPWHPDQLVWPVLATIDEVLGEPWCPALSSHLGHGLSGEEGDLRRNRRWSVARRLAGLFSSYAGQRPTLLTDWRGGRDSDGAGGELAADLRWEAELWRRVLARVDAEPPDVRHARVCERLRSGDDTALDLPARLSLFGHTRLSATDIDLVAALGERRDVHLWLAQPSAALWEAVVASGAGVVARDQDTSADLVHHPLLASLGRDARELALTVGGRGIDAPSVVPPEGRAVPSLLTSLQSDLRANHAPTPAERARRPVDVGDTSIRVHACHGAARQVDVLREVLVGLLADDATLEPRDIIVMCPDIETYAPLISAGFGLGEVLDGGEQHPAHQLRVRLADRAASSTNPLLAVAVALVELAGGRVTAPEVLDLISREPCRRRFGLSDEDLARLTTWVAESGVRWGLDAGQRAAYGMEGFEHNTWRSGLDRLLLGVAMSGDEHRHLGRGLPLDDIGGGEVELVGTLVEAVERLAACLRRLEIASRPAEWFSALREGVLDLCEVSRDDAWQRPQLERTLARAEAAAGDRDLPLRLADVRALLQDRTRGRPTRANFRSGMLTACTMEPMRSVPHRVVCLVGLDDGAFPRSPAVDGDDVLARRPQVGERDARSEDRQLLLDAVLAAGERLVITYTGAEEHSGQERPPAVPLGELLDALDGTAATAVRQQVEVRHPLQPYDVRNHVPGALIGPRAFSFDRSGLGGARAIVSQRRAAPPFLADPLPVHPPRDLTLAELKGFLTHPVRAFLRGRAQLSKPFTADDIGDAIPIDLNGLEKWQIGDRLLHEVLAADDPATAAEAVMLAEQLRGSLPPHDLGLSALGTVVEDCRLLFAATAQLRAAAPRSLDIDVDLGGGRRLTGTVQRVHGTNVVGLSYSKLKPRQRLETWLDVLALSASYPDEHWTGHAVAREKAGPKRALTGPVDHRASEWLADLVALFDLGQTRPLPIPLVTANAWAQADHRAQLGEPVDPLALAGREWVTDPYNKFGITGEDADGWHVMAFGPDAPLHTLLEAGLPELATRVWGPLLLGAERIGPL